jgi:hypothetical protein
LQGAEILIQAITIVANIDVLCFLVPIKTGTVTDGTGYTQLVSFDELK